MRAERRLAGATLLLALLAPAMAPALEPIQTWQTGSGARVLFMPAPALPMVDARVVFDAGSARDGERPGLARLTASLLDQGAGGMTADQIAARQSDLAVQVDVQVDRDRATLSLRTLSKPAVRTPAAGLAATLLARPAFPPDAVERVRGRMLVALEQERQSPGSVARRAFYEAIYRDHPYAGAPSGTQASLEAVTRAEIVAFHRRYFVARNAVVALVGALDRPAAEALAEALVAGLAPGEPAAPLPPVPPLEGPVERRIDHPSTQTHVLVGQPGMTRDDPDYFPLFVGNHVLGGAGLVSLISEEVRERRGLAYSSYSRFTPLRVPGPFALGLQTRNATADQSLEVLRTTLADFVRDGFPEERLDAARDNLVGGVALRLDSNRKLVGYLAMIGFYGLPLDYLERLSERMGQVTAGQVRDAFRRRVQPERMVTVLVGRAGEGGGADGTPR